MEHDTTKRWSYPALALITLLLAACGSSQPPLAPLPLGAVVLAFGDSLTFGAGASAETSYPATLEKLIGRTVIGAGVSGEVTAEGLQRLPALLEKHHPQLVIRCHGGNDFLRRLGRPQLRSNLREMITTSRSHGAEVVLVGVPEPGLFLSAAAEYRDIATEFELPLEDEALARILGDRSLKSDTVHPNAAGYQQLAEAIAKVLSQTGAI